MFCPRCGKELQPGVKFCPSCGFSLETLRQQQTEKESAKPQPTQPAPQPQQPTQTQPPQPQQSQPAQPKKRKLWPIIAAAAAVVVIAIIAVVAFAVLPSTKSAGIWVPTKATEQFDTDDHSSYEEYKWVLDDRGNPKSESRTETYKLTSKDSKGKESTTNGVLVASVKQTFDEEGRPLSRNSETRDVTDDKTNRTKTNETFTWTTDDDGRTTEGTSTVDDGSSCKYTYEYNEQGFISKKGGDGTDIAKSKYTNTYDYGEDGNTIKSVRTNDSRTKEYTYTYERDAKNRPAKRNIKAVNTKTGKTEFESVTTYEYDGNGNVDRAEIEQIDYYTDGTSQRSTSVYTIEYTWVEDPSPWRRQMQHLDMGDWMYIN